MNISFGVNVWSFPHGTSVIEAMKKTAEIGFEGFEVAVVQEDLARFGSSTWREKWTQIKVEADNLNLKMPSVATGLFWKYNMILEEQKREALKVIEVECEVASILNAEVILVVPGVGLPKLTYEKHFTRAVEALKEAAKIAKKHDVKIGVENVWNRVFAGPLEFKKLIDEVNDERVRVYFDIGNTLPHSLPEHWIRMLKKHIIQLHVKDFNMKELRFGIPLTGSVNWIEVRKALSEVKYNGFMVAEVPPYLGNPYKAIYDTYTSLRSIFQA